MQLGMGVGELAVCIAFKVVHRLAQPVFIERQGGPVLVKKKVQASSKRGEGNRRCNVTHTDIGPHHICGIGGRYFGRSTTKVLRLL